MALNFGGLLAGAGVVGQSMRAEEEAQRVARQNQLKIEEQNRLDMLRQQQAKAPAPEAIGTGDLLGIGQQRTMGVEQVAPPQPATSTAVSPQTQAAAAQPNIPYGQQVQNPNYVPPRDDPLRAQAQAQIDQHNARIKDLENSIARMVVTPGMSPDQIAQINRVRLTHFGQIEAEKQKRAQAEAVMNRTSPTIDYGREGRSQMIAQAQPQARVAAAQQYDTAKTNYDDLMAKSAQANGIDPVVFKRLIGTESSFNPGAISPRGEKFGLGIAQIAAVHGLTREQMLDPNTAIPFAAKLFAKYLKESNGNYEEALYKYKGASSDQGRAAMAGPITTILSGTALATAAPAAPAAQPTQVAQAPVGTGVTPQDIQELTSPNASVAMKAFLDKDYNEAYRQWRKTPDAAESKYGMGRLLYEGLGDAPNKEKGLRLLNEAAQQGYAPATSFLARITPPTQLAQAQTGTATDVTAGTTGPVVPGPVVPGPVASSTTPGVKQTPVSKNPTAFYSGNPQAITGDQQILNAQYQRIRTEAIRKFQMAQQAGLGTQAEAIRDQIVQLDTAYKDNSRLLQAMGSVYQLEFANDPRGVSAAMSFYTGMPVAFQPRSDGTYNMWVNGQKVGQPMTRGDVRDAARELFDTKYREATTAARAKFGMFKAEEGVKLQGKLAEINAQMIKDVVVKTTEGNLALKKELATKGWEFKPFGNGETAVFIPPPGSSEPPFFYNATGRTIEIDGIKIQDNSAYPVAGLPRIARLAGL
jgi:soluble lytic murein transglycosylase-like protein